MPPTYTLIDLAVAGVMSENTTDFGFCGVKIPCFHSVNGRTSLTRIARGRIRKKASSFSSLLYSLAQAGPVCAALTSKPH
jgi:hypothetical protein